MVMRFLAFLVIAATAQQAGVEAPASTLWRALEAKRAKLPVFHQEFEVTQTIKTANGSQSSKRQVILDMSQGRWRLKSVSGSGATIEIFDGSELLSMEEGGSEYVRGKQRAKKEDDGLPDPYHWSDADWSKGVERASAPCGLPKLDHGCVILEALLKPRVRGNSPNTQTKMLEGTRRVVIDTENGLILSTRTVQAIENQQSVYQEDAFYAATRMVYGDSVDASLFRLPQGEMSEVKELSRWNAARIKKQLAGNVAPELAVTDIQGKPVRLSALKGKTVLLDFWTTWCGPCRADGPTLDKLYGKYGGRDLAIVGISVSEERKIVEKFLSEHPHGYPIVLTTENEMPRPYQIGVFPTYIVIDRDGTVAAAVEGERGFGDLRKLLKKAGLDTE
jgi:thiol-disulfide isomerase/thioredoxin